MIESVRWLSHRCGGEPLSLVLDLDSAHRTERFRECARELAVQFAFVPTGTTITLQSLDRHIFGELKARARAEFARRAWKIGSIGVQPSEALEILAKSWDLISAENIRKAWNLQ